jgi:hypothetical protein
MNSEALIRLDLGGSLTRTTSSLADPG